MSRSSVGLYPARSRSAATVLYPPEHQPPRPRLAEGRAAAPEVVRRIDRPGPGVAPHVHGNGEAERLRAGRGLPFGREPDASGSRSSHAGCGRGRRRHQDHYQARHDRSHHASSLPRRSTASAIAHAGPSLLLRLSGAYPGGLHSSASRMHSARPNCRRPHPRDRRHEHVRPQGSGASSRRARRRGPPARAMSAPVAAGCLRAQRHPRRRATPRTPPAAAPGRTTSRTRPDRRWRRRRRPGGRRRR